MNATIEERLAIPALEAIDQEYAKARRLAFFCAIFFLPVYGSVVGVGRISQRVFADMVDRATRSDFRKDDFLWWFDAISALQSRLHSAEHAHLDNVFRASYAGLVTAFTFAVALLAAIVFQVFYLDGAVGPASYACCALLFTWFPLSFYAERRLKRMLSEVDERFKTSAADIPDQLIAMSEEDARAEDAGGRA